MKLNPAILLVFAMLSAGPAILAGLSAAGADELSDGSANQASINSRIDQLAKPAGPQTGSQPALDSTKPGDTIAPGSFPRSFLIPGTDTSIRIGGSVDETGRYR